jgi:glycosyltransferase involved in cell wall biosynthesis
MRMRTRQEVCRGNGRGGCERLRPKADLVLRYSWVPSQDGQDKVEASAGSAGTVVTPRVLRVYHAGRDPQHRGRDRAIACSGCDLALVVPSEWPGAGNERHLSSDPFRIIEVPAGRGGDVNRHAYRDAGALRRIIDEIRPDVLDIHEEPVSIAARQWCSAASPDLPIVMYTAQNIDKRFPPPFAQFESRAYRRVAALYPCTLQAASVARGKGFDGPIEVLPLGYDDAIFIPGDQSIDSDELVLAFAGRLMQHKGVGDAVKILAQVHAHRPARLVIAGTGPAESVALGLAVTLGVADRVELRPWLSAPELADIYRAAHFVLVPSYRTTTWVEQFGRVIVEAQACGAVVAGYGTGSIREVAGAAAVLSEEGADSALGQRVIALAGDPDEYARYRAEGIALSQRRTWARVAQRQVNLYREVAHGPVGRLDLPRSPSMRRVIARRQFGDTAATIGGVRPFALPLLRRGGVTATEVARMLDLIAEFVARASC